MTSALIFFHKWTYIWYKPTLQLSCNPPSIGRTTYYALKVVFPDPIKEAAMEERSDHSIHAQVSLRRGSLFSL